MTILPLLQVVTAQYFVWYFSLAPLVLCTLRPASQVLVQAGLYLMRHKRL